MTEPGADPRARGGDDAAPSAVDRYVSRIGKLYGSLATEQLDDLLRVGSNPLCTRAELWAAIEEYARARESFGHYRNGENVGDWEPASVTMAEEGVRALLGLEPE